MTEAKVRVAINRRRDWIAAGMPRVKVCMIIGVVAFVAALVGCPLAWRFGTMGVVWTAVGFGVAGALAVVYALIEAMFYAHTRCEINALLDYADRLKAAALPRREERA